ncbi:MAG: DUF1318 domain-containing protein [Candidatus Omnitrophota bacterium]|jgi:uncharacterized protein YdbL (DUF1318 family)|nr:MAG: DUF1318 domain-containing protein [Candidatus Omnitrophota bacterium]
MKFSAKWITFFIVFALASCVSLTVNVYFPTKEIQQAAEEIEDRIRSGQGSEGMQSFFDGDIPGKSAFRLCIALGGQDAYGAEEINIDINTPIVKKIIDSRTKRYKRLEPLMDQGILGEGMDGFLAIREPKGHDLKTLTDLKKMTKEENDDRELLYKEILAGNKVEATKENLERVGTLFAQAISKKIKVGHWYQVSKDEWGQKKEEK